jgi:hypothetical protein
VRWATLVTRTRKIGNAPTDDIPVENLKGFREEDMLIWKERLKLISKMGHGALVWILVGLGSVLRWNFRSVEISIHAE